MWILLILAFIGIWALTITLTGEKDGWLSFIEAKLIFQVCLVTITELLSLVRAVSYWGISLAWLGVILVCSLWLWRRRDRFTLPKFFKPARPAYWIVDGIIVFILLVTLVIALAAPPNTADVLVNDMPRVAYWVQQGSVRHFAASSETFNSHMPGAEFEMLHLYLLFGGDRLVPLLGWFSFLGAIIAVIALSRELKLNPTGQHFAALFVATMPVAITHASSGKNDLALGFWVVVAILMGLRFLRQNRKLWNLILLACAVGLAILTKESAVIFLAPFALWFAFKVVKAWGWRRLLTAVVWVAVIACALNAGALTRNILTYGGLSDPGVVDRFRNEALSGPILVSNVVRNLSLHAQTPYPWTRAWIYDRVVAFHHWLGVDPSDQRITLEGDFEVPGLITSEVVSGNPVHMTLILVGVLILWVASIWKRPSTDLLAVSVCAALAYILFSAVFKWQVFGARYQFPVLFMVASVPAYRIGLLDRKGWLSAALGVVMLALAGLWLFCLRPRPIIVWQGMTQEVDIFEDRTRLYFPSESAYHYFMEMGDFVEESGCQQVGLHIRGSSMAYLYWVALNKPQSDVQIEYLVAGTPSARYTDSDFEPCAVFCEDCAEDQTSYAGLPLYRTYGYFKLYFDTLEPET